MLTRTKGKVLQRWSRRFLSDSAVPRHYDVLINGGGIVGAAFAAALLREVGPGSKLKIGIVEPRKPLSLQECLDRPTPDIRVYAMSPRSTQILDSFGSWKHIAPRSQPYDSMQVWETKSPGILRFSAAESGLSSLGSIVEDCTVQAAIYQALEESGHVGGSVDFLFGQTITKLDIARDAESGSTHFAQVTLGSSSTPSTSPPATVSARLVVGADGAASVVRKLSGGAAWGWNYGQEALVGTVRVSTPHTTAWQRYLPTGPLALLPLWGGFSSIVWSLPVMEARRLGSLPAPELVDAINAALQSPNQNSRWPGLELDNTTLSRPLRELASLADAMCSAALLAQQSQSSAASHLKSPPLITELASPRVVGFPLQFQQAKAYTSARVALVGDAAHSIHPQAGQGLNLGIADAQALATAVARALASGGDIGDAAFLRREYGLPQSAANLAMMGAVDGLHRVFSYGGKGAEVLQMVRGAGMMAVDSLAAVKSRVAARAMGTDPR